MFSREGLGGVRYLKHSEASHEEEAPQRKRQSKLRRLQNDRWEADHEREYEEEDGKQQRHYETLVLTRNKPRTTTDREREKGTNT